jgi:F1F0 ATPase subunit 2
MSEIPINLLVLCAGVFLGMGFFYSLWWTIQRGLTSKRPAILFLGSLLLRTSITLILFYFIAHGHWQRLLICLLGFLIGRFIVSRFVTISALSLTSLTKEADHAPES